MAVENDAAASVAVASPPSSPAGNIAAYRAHLAALIALVDRCSASMDAAHCDSKQVGPDDKITLQSPRGMEQRQVRFDWLRDVLPRAVAANQDALKAAAKAAAGKPSNRHANQPSKEASPATASLKDDNAKPSAQALLAAARLHLLTDDQAVKAPSAAKDDHARRQQLDAILSQREFDQVEHPSPWDRAVEAFLNWINNLFSRIPSPSHSHWVQWLVEWGIVIAASTGLVWWLVQGSKRERWGLESPGGPRAAAPSLRDWQLWLAEAEALAARGQWREAVHNVYWAAISRLESRGLWPVDRARTPREYLDLIIAADPRHPDLTADLTALTRGFERIWYGYRPAAEPEYRSARVLLEKLAAR